MADSSSSEAGSSTPAENRRSFLSRASSLLMAGGVLASYGTLGVMAGRFLYPSKPRALAWLFVTEVDRLPKGEALQYNSPAGQPITITRQGEAGTSDDFLALSSTCPHLGCQVHWEPHNNRFFCPCHNGVFTPEGKAIAGPPADAGQSLSHYSLKVENGLLFIEVPVETM
jgi:nitrite reductase/ring-hydroxylating ferredoxin subunit